MKSNRQQYLMEHGHVLKLMAINAIPCIITMLIPSIYNIVNQLFIANSGLSYASDASSAVGFVFPVTIVALAFALWIGDGCGTRLALLQGKKDTSSFGKTLGSSIIFVILISLILMVLGLTLYKPILDAFGASEQTIGYAKDYFIPLAIFFPFFMLSNMFIAVVRADGCPLYAMIVMSIGAVLNIGLTPLFCFAFKMGVAGAGYSTAIGQVISVGLFIPYLCKPRTFAFKWKDLIPDAKAVLEPMKLGSSSLVTQLSIVIISLVSSLMIKKYGAMSEYGADRAIKAFTVETKYFTVLIDICIGIALGAQPIWGYNASAKRDDLVRKTWRIVIGLILGITLTFTLFNEIFPQFFISIFGGAEDPLYMKIAIRVFRIFLCSIGAAGFVKATSIFFMSVGKPMRSTVVTLFRDLVLFVGALIILPLIFNDGHNGGVDSLVYAAPFADGIGLLISLGLIIPYFIKLKKHINKGE